LNDIGILAVEQDAGQTRYRDKISYHTADGRKKENEQDVGDTVFVDTFEAG
jgi:hypothetical protein